MARARGKRPKDLFDPEMRQRGLRDADINLAKQKPGIKTELKH